MTELEIIVLANHKFVSSHVLSDREITIGSGEGCTVRLPADGVAPEHAIVHFTGRSCIVEDLETGSGITVKGQQVPSHMVKSDDEIGVGGFTLRFVIHKDEQPAAAAPAAPAPNNLVSMVGRAAPQAQAQQAKAAAPAAKMEPVAPVKVEVKQEPKVAPRVEAKVEPKAEPRPAQRPDPAELHEAKTVVQRRPQPDPKPQQPQIEPWVSPDVGAKAKPAAHAEPPRADATREIATNVLLAPPAGAAHAHDDDDDEEDDENFEPTFSLVSQLTAAKKVDLGGPLVAEAIFYADEHISHIRYLNAGRRLKIDGEQRMVVAHNRDGRLQIASHHPIRAHVFKDGRAQNAAAVQKGKLHVLHLPADSTASVELTKSERLHLQFRSELPPAPPTESEMKLTKPQMMVVGGSFLFHLLAFLFIGLSASRQEAVDNNAGRFAEIETKDLELEKPPEPPKPKEEIKQPEPIPQPKPQPTPQPTLAKKMPTPTKQKPTATPQQAAPPAQQASTPKPSAAASNLLSALGGQSSGGTPSAAAAATTNLDAVSAPHGGGFKVAGVIGKMPGDGLRLASAGGAVGRIDTKSASEFGGKVGKVEGTGPSGKVRGVVTEPPARSVEVQGSLDRGEIQKVVNAHLHEVQACYEHQLVHDPNLSGKVVAEWVITLSGAVGTTRIKNSTVRATEVSSCIQAAVKRWVFPHPKGGTVTVTYPFVFSTVGL